jgi:hypothetical protein
MALLRKYSVLVLAKEQMPEDELNGPNHVEELLIFKLY